MISRSLPSFPSLPSLAFVAMSAHCLLIGCASNYVTPGGPAPFGEFTTKSVADTLVLMPEAPWPAGLAYTRVQASGYRSFSGQGVSRGTISFVGAKDLEREGDLEKIRAWPSLRSVVRLTPILVPRESDSLLALREGAATLRADILALYTLDTHFHVDDRDVGPLGLITLGLAPTRNAVVNCTASIAFFDVRTGYCYGTAEGSANDDQIGNAWTSDQALDDARRRAERTAFEDMLVEGGKVWTAMAGPFTPPAAPASIPATDPALP